MTTAFLILAGLLVLAALCGWLSQRYDERERQRRELHRRLIAHAAEQRMRRLDQAALSLMFDAVRRQGR